MIKEKLNQLRKKSRQYRIDIWGGLSKVWNYGNGVLQFVVPLPDEKKILVNSALAKKRDYENIKAVFPDYELIDVWYRYPAYYNNSMLGVYRKQLKTQQKV